jgi:hypothetical protein
MTPDRLAFRVPAQCPNCGPDAAPHIRIGQTIKGALVHIWWSCVKCDLKWPIEPAEQGDRRVAERRLVMRKRVPLKDRRRAG